MGLLSHFVQENEFSSEFADGGDTILDIINGSPLSEVLSVADGPLGRCFACAPKARDGIRHEDRTGSKGKSIETCLE
jgi:hypothetical protein